MAVREFSRCYRQSLRHFAAMHVLDLLTYEVHRYPKRSGVQEVLQKAERATPTRNLAKLTVPGPGGKPRFHDQPPLLSHVEDEKAREVIASLTAYRDTLGLDRRQALDAYRPVDVTFKVVGTGSVGTRDYVALLLGNGPEDALFLQVKEELPSAWEPALPGKADAGAHQGRRVAEGQHRCQTATDPFVGWTSIAGQDYLVRQLSDHKASLDPTELEGKVLVEYAQVCGETLAKAHARTGDAAIAGYCGKSDNLDCALADFALAYAAQTSQDHAALVAAIQNHELAAEAVA